MALSLSRDTSRIAAYRARQAEGLAASNATLAAATQHQQPVREAAQAESDEAYAAARANGSTGEQARDIARAAAQLIVDEAVASGLVGRGWAETLARSVSNETWENDDAE